MKQFIWAGLVAVGLGGAIAKHALDSWILSRYLGGRFDLLDVFHAGGTVAIAGSGLALIFLAIVTRQRWEMAVRQEAIELLIDHAGRADMPLSYRVAIQYVVQDLVTKP